MDSKEKIEEFFHRHGMEHAGAGQFNVYRIEELLVHTNHLNKALKETTGKTTTAHIAEKLVKEAKALLIYSDWTISEVGYCLGFEHASNFIIFFKKQTGKTPNTFRKE